MWLVPLLLIGLLGLMYAGITIHKDSGADRASETTPDLEATIVAAVETVCGAGSVSQEEVMALRETATAVATYVPPAPTPTPTEALISLSEERLGLTINDRVQMAMKAASLASSETTQAAASKSISAKDLDILTTYWHYSNDLISYVNESFLAYFTTYGSLAAETLSPLQEIYSGLLLITGESRLALMVLDKIGQDSEQVGAVTNLDLSQLETIAERVRWEASDALTQVQAWVANLQPMEKERAKHALSVEARQVAQDRNAAIDQAYGYVNVVETAFTDQKITLTELSNIAQSGADATASMTRNGDEQLVKLAGLINGITTEIASGQMTEAKTGLGIFRAALPARP